MRNLVQRLSAVGDDGGWYDIVHRQVLVQSLLSRLHHSLRAQADMDLVTAVLGLLIAVAKTEPGCSAILSSDLSLMVWLPLSDVKQATKEWLPVFQLCIQVYSLVMTIARLTKITGYDVIHLMHFLAGDNASLQGEANGGRHLRECCSTASGTAHDILAISARLPRSLSRGAHGDFGFFRFELHDLPPPVADATSLFPVKSVSHHVCAHPRRSLLSHQTFLPRHVGE